MSTFSLLPILTLFLTLLTTPVHPWGSLGHRTTTAVALRHFPSPYHPVSILLRTLLNSQDPTTASLFPDKIRYIPKFAYTAPWHYIDSLAVPPQTCSIDLTRDCFDTHGCVVTAIANHTARVADTSLSFWERGQSLRFVLHFFGDVHMPLHTVGWERGGNEVHVVFDGVKTNIHSVWDTLIAKKIVGLAGEGVNSNLHDDAGEEAPVGLEDEPDGMLTWDPTDEMEAAYAWSWFLFNRYSSLPEPTLDEKVCTYDAADCALDWAREANRWICDYVLRDGVEGVQTKDLGGEYFEGAIPIVEELVYKGGRRLAAWLDLVAKEVGKEDWMGMGDGEL